jgi:DNA-binding NtrC family response regulator
VTLARDADHHAATTPLSTSFLDGLRHARADDKRVALIVYHGQGAERVLLNPNVPVTVGRAPPSQVRIDDDSLSREHARFTRSERSVLVEDLRSTNGTWTGGVRVDRSELSPGDEVMLGNVPLRARCVAARAINTAKLRPKCRERTTSSSRAMIRVFSTVTKLARSPIPVLLLGETGTGKEIVARAIHERSPRRARPMVCVNCGAIPPQLVESTLFGHERGAFTGAGQQQRGLFEAADGGTVLLDEVGELPPAAQAALLRVLETRRVVRVGSSREIDVDVRVVAATHRDLEAMCASGGFRLDLLYRLNAMTLTIPPLRARPEEIEPLALRFLQQANKANGLAIRGIEAEALALLQSYRWPGNARELRNAIERAVIVAEGEWIADRDLPERVCGASAREPSPAREAATFGEEPAAGAGGSAGGADSFRTRLLRYEAELIVEALRDSGWNQTEAAHALGMPLRTLVHKIKTLGIKRLGFAPAKDAF